MRAANLGFVSDTIRLRGTYADIEWLAEDAHAELIAGDIVLAPSPTHIRAPWAASTASYAYRSTRPRGPRGLVILDVDVSFGEADVRARHQRG